MTIHVTQVEIDIADELCKSPYEYDRFTFISEFNPVALAMKKHYRMRCDAYSDNLYIGRYVIHTPTVVGELLERYCSHGMKPFSFDIQD